MNQDTKRCCVETKREGLLTLYWEKDRTVNGFHSYFFPFPLQHFMCVSIRHETFKYIMYISWWRIAAETKRLQTASSLIETWEGWRMKPIPNTWNHNDRMEEYKNVVSYRPIHWYHHTNDERMKGKEMYLRQEERKIRHEIILFYVLTLNYWSKYF